MKEQAAEFVWKAAEIAWRVMWRTLEFAYCEALPAALRPRRKIPSQKTLDADLAAHKLWLKSDGLRGRRLRRWGVSFKGLDFSGADLSRASLRNCDFRFCTFAGLGAAEEPEGSEHSEQSWERKPAARICRLDESSLDYSRFESAVLGFSFDSQVGHDKGVSATGVSLVGSTGLFGTDAAFLGSGLRFDSRNPPRFQRWLPNSSIGDFPSWHLMAVYQQLRLLGFSNTLGIFLVAYAAISRWYNSQLARTQAALQENELTDPLAVALRDLHPLPVPQHFAYLLIVICVLVVANLLFSYASPETTVHYRLEGQEHGTNQYVRYMAMDYCRWPARVLTFVMLTTSLIYLAVYFGRRVGEAFEVYLPAIIPG